MSEAKPNMALDAASQIASNTVVAINSVVPEFSAPMTSGQTFKLSNYRGRIVVLYFYPKNGTPGCTTENLNFRDATADFRALGVEIFGVSRDSLRSHEAFKAKLDLAFPLISDTDETFCHRFGVIKNRKLYGKEVRGIERSTFVIDDAGKLVKEWRALRVPEHVDEVLTFVQTLAQN